MHTLYIFQQQEEIATYFAVVPLDGPQLGDPETKPVFEKNFMIDFKKALGKDHKIKEFKHCNFDRIREHLEKAKMIKKVNTHTHMFMNL
jgi:DNA topoisomerase I